MAELTSQERLQPSLLDRLTDDAPDQKSESRERRVLSVSGMRA
ncbi:MAG: type VI secretion system baseplate subunit TssE, partial [Planctomycetota bacterium]|nr:type VI secretion system baseplate subunit TssE [Planctomycetota bacterium]